jgi:hypothetical protein
MPPNGGEMKAGTRFVTAGAALMVAVVLAGAPLALAAGRSVAAGQTLAGVAALIALVAGLAGWPPGIGWSVAGLATSYALGVAAGRAGVGAGIGAHPTAPLEAAGLVLVAELAVWSLESRSLAPDDDDVIAWRLRRLALIEAATIIGGTIVVAASDLPARGGSPLGAIGVASAIAVLALAILGLRRAGRHPGA